MKLKNRKECFDSKKHVKALSYISSNNLKTIIDIHCKKDEVTEKLKENKSVYDRYKVADNFILSKIAGASKEEYYNSHKKN